MPTEKPVLLTNSSCGAFFQCFRLRYWKYEIGLRPEVEGLALRVGRAVHMGLDLYAQGVHIEKVIAEVGSQYIADDPIEAVKVECLLRGHFWRYKSLAHKVLHTELEFSVPLINPATGRASKLFRVAGKMDGIVEDTNARLFGMEHKTTGEDIGPDADFWPRLRIDRQVMIYTLAAQAMGYDVRGTLYNVIRKPTIRQKKTESVQEYAKRLVGDIYERPDFYFQQRLIEHTPSDLDDAARDLWATAKLIRFCQVNAYWPKDDFACKRWGQCAYFGLCTAGISTFDGDVPRGFVRLKNVNPELSIGEEEWK